MAVDSIYHLEYCHYYQKNTCVNRAAASEQHAGFDAAEDNYFHWITQLSCLAICGLLLGPWREGRTTLRHLEFNIMYNKGNTLLLYFDNFILYFSLSSPRRLSHTQPLTENILSQNEHKQIFLNIVVMQSVNIHLLGNVKYF